MGNITHQENSNILELVLGFFDHLGNFEMILNYHDTSSNLEIYGGINKMILNERGNFVYFYSSDEVGPTNAIPRLMEISPMGQIIQDVQYQNLLITNNYSLFDFSDFIQKKYDSTYIATVNISDPERINLGLGGGGQLYVHLDSDFNILDTISIFSSGSTIERSYAHTYVRESEDGGVTLMIYEILHAGSDPNERSRVLFLSLDKDGNLQNSVHFQDGPRLSTPWGLEKAADKGYLFTYLLGELGPDDHWNYVRYLAKVDSSIQLVWKKPIRDRSFPTPSTYYDDKVINKTLDGNYITAGGNRDNNTFYKQAYANLIKFNNDGNFIWERHLYSIEDTSELYPVSHAVYDVIATRDSGYCIVGNNWDFIAQVAGYDGYPGFIIKTNCLGFLGDVEVSANYQAEDDFEISFYNTSRQGGSYLWSFGDGTTLVTDEYSDTVSHTYSGYGIFEVTLIGYGCYDTLGVQDIDTLIFNVSTAKHKDPATVTDGNGYFSIFPNPSIAGADLYIYLNELNPLEGEVVMRLYSFSGQLVYEYPLSTNEGTYTLDSNLSKGVYSLVLIQGDNILQERKLVVN